MSDDSTWCAMTIEDAVGLGWREADSGLGTVTRAWDEWAFVEEDLRAWMHVTLETVEARYNAEWADIMSAPVGPDDGPDPTALLAARMGPLLPNDHEWITFSAAIRDAVSAYEIYLADAFDELLEHHGHQRRNRDRIPRWDKLRELYSMIGVDPKPEEVNEVILLRNLLTHRRGELRTEEDRRRFAGKDSIWGETVAHLDREIVTGYLDRLARQTRKVDPVVWGYSWGRHRVPAIAKSAT